MAKRHVSAPTFVSLFCGCGGFDLGFLREGFRCLGAFDNDPNAVECCRRNAHKQAIQCDLSDNPGQLLSLRPTVVLAGPPCQGFSTAGKRIVDDPRNDLVPQAVHLASTMRPEVVLLENVGGILSGQHRTYWETAEGSLQSSGYRTASLVINSQDLGVPQTRKRAVLFAWRSRIRSIPDLNTGKSRTLRDALSGNLAGLSNHEPKPLRKTGNLYKISCVLKQGQKLSDSRNGKSAVHTWEIPQVFGRTTSFERTVLLALLVLRRRDRRRDFGDGDPVLASSVTRHLGKPSAYALKRLVTKGYVRRAGHYYDLAHTFNGKCRRLSWDRPAPTVDTKFGDPRYFLHPEEHRGFTVREAARIQTFPDDFVFSGPMREQYRRIGNAVPPLLASRLAAIVRYQLLRN